MFLCVILRQRRGQGDVALTKLYRAVNSPLSIALCASEGG